MSLSLVDPPELAPKRVRILLVDDHPFVRDGIVGLLQTQPEYEVVGCAATVAEGLAMLHKFHPTLAIIDLRLPDGDGIQILNAVAEMRWETFAVALSAFSTEDDLLAAARAGAAAFLTKTAPAEEVLETLRRVLAGENVLVRDFPAALRQRLQEKSLTEKEIAILALLGRALSNRQISERTGLSDNTIKTHLRRIFKKLAVSSRSEATAIALHRGLV